MQRRTFLSALPAALCLPLGACAAALIPVAAGGIATHQGLKARKGGHAPEAAGTTSGRSAPQAKAPDVAPPPADTAVSRAWHIYAGSLPAPVGVDAAAPSPAVPPLTGEGPHPTVDPTQSLDPTAGGWGAALRYVAGQVGSSHSNSVLLARGASLDAPRWVPCGDKPQAVLVDLEAVVPPGGAIPDKIVGVLGALETLDIASLYMTSRAGSALTKALARFDDASLRAPKPGSAVFAMTDGKEAVVRATAGTTYCVVALIGSRAEDFPNKASRETVGAKWNPGWFTVPVLRD